jgi:hypothetical protein
LTLCTRSHEPRFARPGMLCTWVAQAGSTPLLALCCILPTDPTQMTPKPRPTNRVVANATGAPKFRHTSGDIVFQIVTRAHGREMKHIRVPGTNSDKCS